MSADKCLVTYGNSAKKVEGDLSCIRQNCEKTFGISLDDKILQIFDKEFDDWIDLENELPPKSKLRILSKEKSNAETPNEKQLQPQSSSVPQQPQISNPNRVINVGRNYIERDQYKAKEMHNYSNNSGPIQTGGTQNNVSSNFQGANINAGNFHSGSGNNYQNK